MKPRKPSLAGNTAAFVLCGGLSYWLIHPPGGERPAIPGPAVTDVEAAKSPEKKASKTIVVPQLNPALTEAEGHGSGGRGGPLSDTIEWRRKLESMPLSEFPNLFEEELLHAADSVSIYELVEVWMDRDLEAHIAWLRTQPNFRRLVDGSPPGGYTGVGMYDQVLGRLGAERPEDAWKLAGELTPGNGNGTGRWGVVRSLLEADPAAAAAFVKKHRDSLAGYQNPHGGFYAIDPMAALPAVRELPSGAARMGAVQELARRYTETAGNLEEAGKWFLALPEDSRKQLAKSIAGDSDFSGPKEQQEQLRKVWVMEGQQVRHALKN